MGIRGSKFILIFCVILVSVSTIKAIDISNILDNYQEFSLFRDLLIRTNVEKEINNRHTLTVLVLDNSVMGSIMSKPWDEAGKILATHVILDYFDETRLLRDLHDKSTLLTTLFQASGHAVNQQGLLNVTVSVSDGGGVVFGSAVPGAPHASKMVRSVVANPYEISVIQISQPIMTPGLGQISPFSSPSTSPSATSSPVLAPTSPNEHGASPTINDAIDIAKLLDNYVQFASFRDLLRRTNLEKDINARHTITVLIVDNSMMDAINRMPLDQSRRILATHVILDYYDDKKLAEMRGQTAILTTFFQATGMAIDEQGFLKVTISDGGDVEFGSAVQGAPHVSKMVRSVVAYPYEISVIQISQPIITPGLVALPPSLSPSSNPSPTPSTTSPAPASAPNGHITSPTPAPIPTPQNEGSRPVPVPAPALIPTPQNYGSPVPVLAPIPTSQNKGSPVPIPVPVPALIPTPENEDSPVPVPGPEAAFHEGPSLTPVPTPHGGAVPTLAPHEGLTPAPSPHHHEGASEGPESEDEDDEDAGAPEESPQRAPAPAPAPPADDKEAADRLAPAKLIKNGAAHVGVGSGAVVAALVVLATLTLA